MRGFAARNLFSFGFALVLLLAGQTSSFAVPAAPGVRTLTQADGTTFQAVAWGDENYNGFDTVGGYAVLFDEKTKNWHFAEPGAAGRLQRSGRVVGKDAAPAVGRHLREGREARAARPRKSTSRERARASASGGAFGVPSGPAAIPPTTGSGNVPVILINFSDRSTSYTVGNFEDLLFLGTGHTMKTFYEEVSYGQFSVTSGPGGIKGWYTAANGHDYYGANDGGGWDRWPGTLVREAVIAADATMDFAPYDQDGDCYVDVVDIVHQGTGEEASGPVTDIWSHRWDLNSANILGYSNGGPYETNDSCPGGGSIWINDYVIQPEKLYGGISTIGVFAHEYGHALGLPDLYDTDYGSEGIGDWSAMAGGSWNGIITGGDRPAHMDAWCKYALGWVTPQVVTGSLSSESIDAAASSADVYQFRSGSPGGNQEYFLVENRQMTGFDAGLPGSGLLVWHIDETEPTNSNECYPPSNCTSTHFHVALVQADNEWHLEKGTNRGDPGDPFPGSPLPKTLFDGSTSPSSDLWNGQSSDITIANISASGNPMTADLSVLTPAGAPGAPVVPPSSSTGDYPISWAASATGGVDYVLEEATNSGFTSNLRTAYTGPNVSAPITSRPTGSTYYYRVKATRAGYGDSAWVAGANGCLVLLPCAAPGVPVVPATSDNGEYAVSWAASATSAVTYTLQEATDAGFTTGLRTAYTGADLSAPITGRLTATTYYYRVKAARLGYAESSWSPGANGCAVTITVPPAAFAKSDPAAGAVVTGLNPTLGWGTSTAAASYEYCYDTTDDQACGGSWTNVGAATSAGLSGLAFWTTYYWQVRAVNGLGATEADGGAWWSFRIEAASVGTAWQKQFGGAYYESGNDIAFDWGGSTYVVGDNRSASGAATARLTKYNNSGAVVWERSWSGSGAGVAVAPDGSVYVTGKTGPNLFLKKFRRSGSLAWTRSAAGYGKAVAVAPDNKAVYVAGSSAGDILVRKFTTAGAPVWAKTCNGTARRTDEAAGIAVGTDGSVYVTGYVRSTGRGKDVWLRKYSAAGAVRWTKVVSGVFKKDDWGAAVFVSGANVYLAGTVTTAGGRQLLVSRYSAGGSRTWSLLESSASFAHLAAGDLALSPDGLVQALGTATAPDGTTSGYLRRVRADGVPVDETSWSLGAAGTSTSFSGIAAALDGFLVTGRLRLSATNSDRVLLKYQ